MAKYRNDVQPTVDLVSDILQLMSLMEETNMVDEYEYKMKLWEVVKAGIRRIENKLEDL